MGEHNLVKLTNSTWHVCLAVHSLKKKERKERKVWHRNKKGAGTGALPNKNGPLAAAMARRRLPGCGEGSQTAAGLIPAAKGLL